MRASQLNIVTLREDPADAEIASHRLLTRAGYLSKSGSGVYVYGHLLHRVIDHIRRIVSEEITRAGGVEITMPILQERGLWERSGRWAAYQASRTMLTVTDRGGQEFGLAPTAEEVVTAYAGEQINSYKQLPVCYFQQNTKFRDEIRPRFGLMRVKEFIMMDAYSFHADEASLEATYQAMHEAYLRAFRRCGLEAFAVEADTGAIGGSASHEFMIAADVGEDAIVRCSGCGYAANIERAEGRLAPAPDFPGAVAERDLHTPGAGAIDDVVAWLRDNGFAGASRAHLLKAVLFVAETPEGARRVAAYVRGDRDVNEVKVRNAITAVTGLEVLDLRPMQPEEIQQATGARPGFAGPGLAADVELVDSALSGADAPQAVVAGANRDDHHRIVAWGATPPATMTVADLALITGGDACPRCGAAMVERRGIEAGHIFQLGTKYSAAMGAEFNGRDGQRHPLVMGCYGIGTSRVAAAAVEQHHDVDGICWPMAIAPYQVVVVPTRADDEQLMGAAEGLYQDLLARGISVVLDDRDAKPGVKFKDWDLVGIPIRVVAGRSVADGSFELKPRTGEREDVPVSGAAELVAQLVTARLAE